MKPISADHLLSQIRTMGHELRTSGVESASPPAAQNGFGTILKDSLDAVNDAQSVASDLRSGFENGTGDKSLAEVMIAGQKSSLAFRAVTEVRNKVVTAYQDIMNMPV